MGLLNTTTTHISVFQSVRICSAGLVLHERLNRMFSEMRVDVITNWKLYKPVQDVLVQLYYLSYKNLLTFLVSQKSQSLENLNIQNLN